MNPIRYRGYFYDFETGFYYLQNRYYDPQIKRFINSDDPEILANSDTFLGYNLFSYCENNPVTNYDPSGNISVKNILSKIGSMLSGIVKKFGEYCVSLIEYNKQSGIFSMDTGLIAIAIDALLAFAVTMSVHALVKVVLKTLASMETVAKSFLETLYKMFVGKGIGAMLIKAIVNMIFGVSGLFGIVLNSVGSFLDGFFMGCVSEDYKFIEQGLIVVTSIGSIGGIVALALDYFADYPKRKIDGRISILV